MELPMWCFISPSFGLRRLLLFFSATFYHSSVAQCYLSRPSHITPSSHKGFLASIMSMYSFVFKWSCLLPGSLHHLLCLCQLCLSPNRGSLSLLLRKRPYSMGGRLSTRALVSAPHIIGRAPNSDNHSLLLRKIPYSMGGRVSWALISAPNNIGRGTIFLDSACKELISQFSKLVREQNISVMTI